MIGNLILCLRVFACEKMESLSHTMQNARHSVCQMGVVSASRYDSTTKTFHPFDSLSGYGHSEPLFTTGIQRNCPDTDTLQEGCAASCRRAARRAK